MNQVITEQELAKDNKIEALAEYLGLDTDFITDNDGMDYEAEGKEYKVLTDEEADEAAADYIRESVWAFNKDFIIQHSKALDFDKASEQILEAIQEQCESGNAAITKLIDDMDEFIDDAISADGRGHFLSGYDGEENEQTINGTTYYIYRTK